MPKNINQNLEVQEEQPAPAGSQEEVIPPEPHFLTEDALRLWKFWEKAESPREIVPPQTPNSEYNFSNPLHPFPETFPTLDDLEVPFVRDKGVKFCIDSLGEFFGCKDYKFNLLQFWFLDVLTDCIWAAQDNFRLPVDEQKIVLAWILYLINLIRDPEKNLSRREFFTVFKEAILVAAEVIDEGSETVPPPEQLFALIQEENELQSWTSSDSESKASSVEISDKDLDNISCIDLEIDETRRRFVLPEEVCNCAKYDLAAVDSISEIQSKQSDEKIPEEEEGEEENEEEHNNEEEHEEEDIEFYKPDDNIPARFLPLPKTEEIEEECDEEEKIPEKRMCKIKNSENQNTSDIQPGLNQIEANTADTFGVYEIPEKMCMRRTSEISKTTKSSSVTVESGTSNSENLDKNENGESNTKFSRKSTQSSKEIVQNAKLLEQYKKKQVLKDLAFQKLLEQRFKDMANPKKGWMPPAGESEPPNKEESAVDEAGEQTSEEDEASGDEEWADIILNEQKEQVQSDEDKLILNFGVLRAIIDFVFKYFYESFQFTLIKLAFQATPDIVSQKVNHEWKIPKRIRQELQKPKVEKVKKPKEKKEKKEKPAKDKSKKDKASKPDKKKPDKESKKGKKEAKEKPHKLTKEEKDELERQRKEQERIEAELMKIEENKRFVFPLTDAASDDLFNKIFENWVKVDLSKKGKGKGAGKEKKGKGKK